MEIALRDFEVFRGDLAALPEAMAQALTHLGGMPQVLRVAKLGEQVIGSYAMYLPLAAQQDTGAQTFVLAMVMVEPSYQRNGVGRWLVGHAIGVAESKGGRYLATQLTQPADFFIGLGFKSYDGGFRFAMYRE